MDIKIDSVFSLFKENDESKTEESQSDNGESKETTEPDEHNVVVKQEKVDPGYDNATDWENDWWKRMPDDEPDVMDWSAEDDVKPFQDDGDSPPDLLMEQDRPVLRSMLNRYRDVTSPPVLLPQVDMIDRTIKTDPDTPRKCTKIHPCYIVLTKVDRFIKGMGKISYRTFRRTYRECPNICKHRQFRRKLDDGHDVFNVKVPSKSIGYRECLELNRRSNLIYKSEIRRSSPKIDKRYKDLIKKYANSVHAGGAGRIMRSIQSMPKDFRNGNQFSKEAMLKQSTMMIMKNIMEARIQVITETEKEIEFKRELFKLKGQVDFQRSTRKATKKYQSNVPGYFKSGTSLVSGRVRKTNTKYGEDFLKSKDEIVYHQSLQTFNKRLERENKKAEEEEKMQREKKLRIEQEKELQETFQLVIDNPERGPEEKPSEYLNVMNSSGKVTKYSMLSQEEKDRINARRRELQKIKKTSSLKSIKKTDQSKKRKAKELHSNKDGVIIKDIPYGDLADMLLSEDMASTGNKHKEETAFAESDGSIDVDNVTINADQFYHAKSILKKSVNNDNGRKSGSLNDNQSVKQISNSNSFGHAMDPDRAKALRIPEKVRLLFMKDKNPNNKPPPTVIHVPTSDLSGKVIKKVNGAPIVWPDNPNAPGESQQFIITTEGLIRRVVWPEPVKTTVSSPTTNIGMARQLLASAVSNTQQDKSKIIVNVPISAVSQQRKVKEEKPSNGYPETCLTQSQSNTTLTSAATRTMNMIASGQNKPQQTINTQPTGDKAQTNKNLYYQIYMGGKKYLVPAAPGLGQQKLPPKPLVNLEESKETDRVTSQIKVEEIKPVKPQTFTLVDGSKAVSAVASNSVELGVREQRVPLKGNSGDKVDQPVKVYKPPVDVKILASGKNQKPSTTYPVTLYSSESPGKQVSDGRILSIPIRFASPTSGSMQDSKKNIVISGRTGPVLSNSSTHASQTLLKMCNSKNLTVVYPGTERIASDSTSGNVVVKPNPVANPAPIVASVNSESMNNFIDPKALTTLLNQVPGMSGLKPAQTLTQLNNGLSPPLVNPASMQPTVNPPTMSTLVNPTQLSSPVNPTPVDSSKKAMQITTLVHRAPLPVGMRFMLVPASLPNNTSNINMTPVQGTYTSVLSTAMASPTVSSVASTYTTAASSSLNKQTLNPNRGMAASNALGFSSQTKLTSMLPQKAKETQSSGFNQKVGVVQKGSVDITPNVIKIPISKQNEANRVEEQPVPFAEAVSAREERLKKLKETLKEKQDALEKLRQQRMNKDSGSEAGLVLDT